MAKKKMGRNESAAPKTSDQRNSNAIPSSINPLLVSATRRGFLPTNIAHSRVKCWLCQKLCGDQFFNRDASLEIDRLVLENERLRAGGTR